MRLNLLILLAVVVAGAALTFWLDESGPPAQAPKTQETNQYAEQRTDIPPFSFTTIDGTTRTITDFKGKIILLNFWASWCAPCVVEFPKLVDLAAQNKDIVLIALSSDVSGDQISRFLDKQPQDIRDKIKLPNILVAKDRHGEITETLFQTYKLPETILIDRAGKIADKIVGDTDWAGEEIKTRLSKL